MWSPKKKDKSDGNGPSPDDTQEMFTAGQPLPEDPEETREYETVATVDAEEPETAEAETEDEPVADEEPDEPIEDDTEVEAIEDDTEVEAIEDEAWAGDEYDEWDEELEEESDEEPDEAQAGQGQKGEKQVGFADALQAKLTELAMRAGRSGAGLLKRVGEIKLPNHELDGQKVLVVAGIAAIAVLVGAGGYVLGKGSGKDLDTARLEGEFAGKRAGAIEGATKGYALGFKKGRDLSFAKSYEASYRRNYRRAYEDVGMDAPRSKSIQVPEP